MKPSNCMPKLIRCRSTAARILVVVISVGSLVLNFTSLNHQGGMPTFSSPTTANRVGPPRTFFLGDSFHADGTTGRKTRPLKDVEMMWTNTDRLNQQDDADNEEHDDPHCQPMADWQRKVHPVCNDFHATSSIDSLVAHQGNLLKGKGAWRRAWNMTDAVADTNTVLKTLKMKHFEKRGKGLEDLYHGNAVDALAMEQLTASPHTINLYGFCGSSITTEFASVQLSDIIPTLGAQERLAMAIAIAKGVADIHGIGDRPSLAHYDLHPGNVVFTSADEPMQPLLNDFNFAVLLQQHNETGQTCRYKSCKKSLRRPPEEYLNSTFVNMVAPELVDVYSLGNFFYLFATGKEPWELPAHKPGSGGYRQQKRAFFERTARLKVDGSYPPLPDDMETSPVASVKLLLKAMRACYRFDPQTRPSAAQVVSMLTNGTDSESNGRHF